MRSAKALGLALGLALAAAGSARAFPKPKYATNVDDSQPASSAPASSAPKSSAPKSSRPGAKTATVSSAQLAPAAPNPANQQAAAKPATAEPAVLKTAEGSKGWSIYVVHKGDTLSGVSRRFAAPVKTLADLNELDPKLGLKPGLKLKLPPGTADSGKDPYAAGPSPFALANEPATHAAASGAKPKLVRIAQAAPVSSAPVSSAPAASSQPHAAVVAAKPAPAPAKEASAEPAPVRVALTPKPAPAPVETPAVSAPEAEAPPQDPAVAAGRGRFVWPLKGEVLSRFGPLAPGERNDGVNIGAEQGADVHAAAAGEVVYAGSDVKGYGNVVLIMHPNGWDTVYAHLDSIKVRMRDHVAQGETIGTVGRTGGVDQPQLHFETRFSGAPHEKHKPVDPLTLLR